MVKKNPASREALIIIYGYQIDEMYLLIDTLCFKCLAQKLNKEDYCADKFIETLWKN
ncbi:hypothetical protein LVD15_21410 [Fulvivirga maritima]|uniref:hypothetical protein n=1 Tax=Fulvivirga maritima TaxID=2904247 RepID=UPI001F2C089A|nr:hypothetical protein [Fulvivirga maritima]UII25833.1 hypothetical protein LVD15_21410 [Fulvivirga maritima]